MALAEYSWTDSHKSSIFGSYSTELRSGGCQWVYRSHAELEHPWIVPIQLLYAETRKHLQRAMLRSLSPFYIIFSLLLPFLLYLEDLLVASTFSDFLKNVTADCDVSTQVQVSKTAIVKWNCGK